MSTDEMLSGTGGFTKTKKWQIQSTDSEGIYQEKIELALEFALDMLDEVHSSLNFVKTCLETGQGEEKST